MGFVIRQALQLWNSIIHPRCLLRAAAATPLLFLCLIDVVVPSNARLLPIDIQLHIVFHYQLVLANDANRSLLESSSYETEHTTRLMFPLDPHTSTELWPVWKRVIALILHLDILIWKLIIRKLDKSQLIYHIFQAPMQRFVLPEREEMSAGLLCLLPTASLVMQMGSFVLCCLDITKLITAAEQRSALSCGRLWSPPQLLSPADTDL